MTNATSASIYTIPVPSAAGHSKKMTYALWTAQVVLALLFLFAGGMKLVLPIAALTSQMQMPGLFLRFIGVAEVAGALGLVLPGLLRIHTDLTSVAAAGLVLIMVGAVAVSVIAMGPAGAIVPFITGCLAAFIAISRKNS